MSGYVGLTNVPKHAGSILWSSGWQFFIIIAALTIVFADVALALPERNNIFWRIIKMFWLDGMTYTKQYGTADPYDTSRDPIPFFLAPLALFKVFLTFGYMSQSFYGVDTGLNQWGEQKGPNTQLFCLAAGFSLAGSSLFGLFTGSNGVRSTDTGLARKETRNKERTEGHVQMCSAFDVWVD
ncbi:hypothetical protein QFC19_006503 [Naganishia cerealis]|uniref:Uncharacterized protein n=1 Tax=Naganishia cerealis TaxID=610337 RepID=A0ACC2VG03_9TREE|nr:hypothetical protein QFC19_006503 [Naganishia cerealis]